MKNDKHLASGNSVKEQGLVDEKGKRRISRSVLADRKGVVIQINTLYTHTITLRFQSVIYIYFLYYFGVWRLCVSMLSFVTLETE